MRYLLNFSLALLLLLFSMKLNAIELPDSNSTNRFKIFLQGPDPAIGFEKVLYSNNSSIFQAFISYHAGIFISTQALFYDTLKSPSHIAYPNPFGIYEISPYISYGIRFFLDPTKAFSNKFHPFLSFSKESSTIPNDIILGGGILYTFTKRFSLYFASKMAFNLIDKNFILIGATYGIRTYTFNRLALRFYLC